MYDCINHGLLVNLTMVNCCTCCKGESVETTEDAEAMQFRGQQNVKYLKVWRTKFEFNGELCG